MSRQEKIAWGVALGVFVVLMFVVGMFLGGSIGYKNGQIDYAQGIKRYLVVDGHVLKFVGKLNSQAMKE